jgi:hypothetical protein
MENSHLTELSSKIGLTFPPGTQVLGVRELRGQDDAILLKVKLGKDQWGSFLASSPFKDKIFSEGKRYLLGPNDDWWNPKQPETLPTAQAALPNAKILNLGVDQKDSTEVIVYVMWHET